MPFYKIYAGLSGGFGGAEYVETLELDCYDDALQIAYESAKIMYHDQSGLNGIRSFEEIIEEEGCDVEEAEEIYMEECENWIDYDAIETDSLEDTEE